MRITDMIKRDKVAWYFINFSPLLLWEIKKIGATNENSNFDLRINEGVSKILWCGHSYETSLPVLSDGATCVSAFCKNKIGNLSKFDVSHFYKITKIVCTPWLAERSIRMRVCKHGCDVKMFCFSRTNHGSTNLKKYLSSKLDEFTLFTHSFISWNLEHLYKQAVSILFSLKLTF